MKTDTGLKAGRRGRTMAAALLLLVAGGCVGKVEEQAYTVVRKSGSFELRDYPSFIVAETVVDGTLKDAGNKAFGKLFAYISGKNRTQNKIAMTTPVSQQPSSETISMTAPVGQQRGEGGWAVSFTMPASYATLDSLPAPESPEVKLRQVPACRMAVVRYSGTWSEARYLRHKQELESWIAENNLQILGPAVWARYNPPFTPWLLRRNEIQVPVAKAQAEAARGGE